jgi:hypothetical protein
MHSKSRNLFATGLARTIVPGAGQAVSCELPVLENQGRSMDHHDIPAMPDTSIKMTHTNSATTKKLNRRQIF